MIAIIDCGGQYTHRIAQVVRSCGVESRIFPANTDAYVLTRAGARGIIISGGPKSVYEEDSPVIDKGILGMKMPVLGICYGLQLIAKLLGGQVERVTARREYGPATVHKKNNSTGGLLQDCSDNFTVWMSHGDSVTAIPMGFSIIASSPACPYAAIADESRGFYGLQFHPEVQHAPDGRKIIQRFLALCNSPPWEPVNRIESIIADIRQKASNRQVLMLISGGVDSAVAFKLIRMALPAERIHGLFIDNGLLRRGEVAQVMEDIMVLGECNLSLANAGAGFLSRLTNIVDPQAQRKIIGDYFIEVAHEQAGHIGFSSSDNWCLADGSIYPDVVESAGGIKTHHNRVETALGMVQAGRLIQPLADYYKDEVREIGSEIGMPDSILGRHPFPGPGLAVRILCALEEPPLLELKIESCLHHRVLPMYSVGVQGDQRTYKRAVALWVDRPEVGIPSLAIETARQIPNKEPDVNRVLLCLSHYLPPEFIFTPTMINPDTVDLLQVADETVNTRLVLDDLYDKVWQFPIVLAPFGTKPGGRSVILRPVESQDGMTATAVLLPPRFFAQVTEVLMRIPGIDAVFLDLSSKPPSTIELK